ncbi:peptidase [Rhizobiaceae bacterium]|nr:peptidase [Rhizobiaceae bacterium]
MTYCVGMRLDRGLVFMSDTRTNAGVDNISSFKKMFTWSVPGERVITLMTAGNLATTQALCSTLDERTKTLDQRDPTILQAPSMFEVARLVGHTLREMIERATGESSQTVERAFTATLLLGGQVKGGEPRLYMIYPEGNFMEATKDSPFLQIGETKYGKPILVRAYDPKMTFEQAVKLLLVSFDSTIKANLGVDLPIDLQVYENDTLKVGSERRFQRTDADYEAISEGWGDALRLAFASLPDPHITPLA